MTFDTDFTDQFSLAIPEDESPLEIELVVLVSVEAEVGLEAF